MRKCSKCKYGERIAPNRWWCYHADTEKCKWHNEATDNFVPKDIVLVLKDIVQGKDEHEG